MNDGFPLLPSLLWSNIQFGGNMSDKIILHASDLDGYLSTDDQKAIDDIAAMYRKYLGYCNELERGTDNAEEKLSESAAAIGHKLEEICSGEPRIHVYSFETPNQ